MVTKMKMFGFIQQSQVNNQVKNKEQQTTLSSSSSKFNMKNLASIMKIQNTGCKSCSRG